MRYFAASLCLAVGLSGCLEPQTIPDLPALSSDQFQIETVADGLNAPWAVEVTPNGDYIVTGNHGELWEISENGRTEIGGLNVALPDIARDQVMTEGQGGLLDIGLTPEFAQTGEIYLSYSYGDWDANGTALIRAKLDGNRLRDARTVFKVPLEKEAGAHFGGRIGFLPDQTVLLTLGDGFALREEAQKTSSHIGSIIRIQRDGAPAADNPDFGEGSLRELYSIGHRNVQGLAIDPVDGVVWAHEHGPRGGDELNRITAGENYGWPIVTKGRDYQGARISPHESDPRFEDAFHGWTPSIAPSGLAIYRGDLFTDWEGAFLIGGLASGDVRLVRRDGSETILLGDMKREGDAFRVRDVKVDNDGAILVLIDDPENGRLLRLTPR